MVGENLTFEDEDERRAHVAVLEHLSKRTTIAAQPRESLFDCLLLTVTSPGAYRDGRGTEGEPGKSLRSKTYLCRGSEKCRNNMAFSTFSLLSASEMALNCKKLGT